MNTTSNNSEQKQHTRYMQLKVSISAELAAAFKASCQTDKVSMASELSNFMAIRSGIGLEAEAQGRDLLSSRGGRRKRITELMQELEQIKCAESRYRDAIPENLCGSIRYDNAEESVNALEEAIATLAEAY